MDAQEIGTAPSDTEVEQMARHLMGLMEREIDGVTLAEDDWGADSIHRLDLSSLALVGFLVAVEEDLGIEWKPDMDTGVLRSFDVLATYVLTHGGTAGNG